MNFYEFHIGDYAVRTAHLEPMEDLAYRRMLDLYYTREFALPTSVEEIARLIRMRAHSQEIEAVLREFFVLSELGWTHEKCEEVISAIQAKSGKASNSARIRWERIRAEKEAAERATQKQCEPDANALQSHSEGNAPTTHYPLPITQSPTDVGDSAASAPEPATSKRKTKPSRSTAEIAETLTVADLITDGVERQHAEAWMRVRKAARAPLTQVAWDGFKAQAEKASITPGQAVHICAVKSWRGFDASWPWKGVIPGINGKNKGGAHAGDVEERI